MDTEKSVLVAVRSRPLLLKNDETYNPALLFSQNEVALQDKGFSFDYVFPPNSTNFQVYNTAVAGRLPRIFEGYNLTIFAYGQTGSGKTYTMGTNYSSDVQKNESGIIFLSVSRIFEDLKEHEDAYEFTVNVSFLEVYKEDVYDLLSKEKKSSSCQIREDFEGVKVVNLTEAPVKSVDEVLSVLEQGCQTRSTASTAMNAQSSRSHSLFILTIEQRNKENFESRKSKFQLVDLAGSERADQSKTEGLRFKEGVDINRGLLALGKVISALSDGRSHVPYRDSKLTRLLMDSLGGNSYTIMIACISPSLTNSDETISTLRYASRARKIKNKPMVNKDPPDVQIQKLKQQVELLQGQLYKRSSSIENISGLDEYSELKEKNKNLKNDIHKYISRIAVLNEQLNKSEETLGFMKEKVNSLFEQIQCCINKCNINDPSSVKDLIENLKAVELEFKSLVCESQNNLHVIKMDCTVGKDLNGVCNISSGSDTSDEDNSDLEIADIGRRLEKVELQLLKKQEIAEHFEVLNVAIEESSTQNINVLQEKIDILMKEKNGLELALKNSVMLNEEHNKRYKECQSEMKTLEKELMRNKFIRKVKEESKIKIENLQREIQNLKSMKVKLLKKMKTETDNFKRMQMAKDKEVEKLKKNERKKDFEILKLKNNFDKQVNAFRQKIEKYQSLSKRLNEALSRQKNSQIFLKDKKIPKQNMEDFLIKEIEVEALKRMASTEYISAKENMGHLTVEAQNIKEASEANDGNNSSSLVLLTLEMEKFGQQRLAQNEATPGEKNLDRWKTINSMTDAKTALAVLFEKCIEGYVKTNSDTGTTAVSGGKDSQVNSKEHENCKQYLAQIKSLKDKMTAMKRDYENKLEKEKCEQSMRVIQGLKKMNDLKKLCLENQQDSKLLEKIELQYQVQESDIEQLSQKFEDNTKLREEVEFWKAECKKLMASKKRRYLSDFGQNQQSGFEDTTRPQSMIYEYLEEDFDEDSFHINDDNKDPDWRMTPINKQRKRTLHRMKEFSDDPETDNNSEIPPAKRSFSGCSCPGDCKTMRCACKKKMKMCDAGCNCDHKNCLNVSSEENS